MSKKLAMVLGIRPDVIRCAILIKLLKENLGEEFVFIWSGQHYSDNMKDIFFRELEVPQPDITFQLDTTSDVSTISSLNLELDKFLKLNDVSAVVYLGDTNTVISSIVCAANNVPIVHIEGCMRSYDWRMPEEKYRTLIDHLADVIYAYLDEYKEQGIAEGLIADRIIVTGNPIVDVLNEYFLSSKIRLDSKGLNSLFEKYEIEKDSYWLMTCHRRENIDDQKSLNRILDLCKSSNEKVIFPAGYRTQRKLQEFGLELPSNIMLVDPIGYVELLELMHHSTGVITDSGTIVEEASVLGVPSIQMRLSTERPQVYDVGSSIKFNPTVDYCDDELQKIILNCKSIKGDDWNHPFGDGNSSKRISADLIRRHKNNEFRTHVPNLNNSQVARNFGEGYFAQAKSINL